MRVYLAAMFALKHEIAARATELRTDGLHVTSRWLDEQVAPSTTMDQVTDKYLIDTANIDIDDILDSDILAIFTQDPKTPFVRGGRMFEAGFAFGRGIRVITIGPKENIFFHLAEISNFPTWEEAKQFLKEEHAKREAEEARRQEHVGFRQISHI